MKHLLTSLIFFFVVSAAAATAQTWAVAVNAADLAELGTLGVEGAAAVGQHWSIHASAKVNPWTFARRDTGNGLFSEPNPNQKQNRKQEYAIGARWWPWNVYSGWWVGGKGQYQEFKWVGGKGQYQEFNRGGFFTETSQEGDAFGAGFAGGYSLMLKEHWNLDFGLGGWGGRQRLYEGTRRWFAEPEATLGVMFVF